VPLDASLSFSSVTSCTRRALVSGGTNIPHTFGILSGCGTQQIEACVDLPPTTAGEVQVPAFGGGAVRETIERSFRKPVEDIFEEFNFKPIAAASLGQVHLAKLNGKRVVVKVQRPGLKNLFDVDLKNVRVIAQWLQVRSIPI
jgi:hypothetical protein